MELLTNKNIDEVQMPENLTLAIKVIMFRMRCADRMMGVKRLRRWIESL